MKRFLRIAAAALMAALALLGLAAAPLGARIAASAIERVSAPGLELHQPAGSLLGTLKIARVAYAAHDWQVVAEDVEVRWRPRSLADGLLSIERLDVGRLQVTGRSTEGRAEPPAALTLPMPLEIGQFRIVSARFGANGREPAFEAAGIEGRFASDGRRHRLEALRLSTDRLAVEASGELVGRAPFPLKAAARIAGEASGHAFVVRLEADGPLRALKLVARSASGPAQADADMLLDLFARQPVVRGRLTAADLDPAAWLEGAPHARLDVRAEFVAERDAFRGTLSCVNRDPGPLDETRLPVSRFEAEGRGDGRRIAVRRFSAALAGGEAAGEAALERGGIAAAMRLSGVDAAAWHKTLPRTRLGGDLKLDAHRRDGNDAPQLSLHWALRDSSVAGRALAGRGDVVMRRETLERADVTMRAGDNALEMRGSLGRAQDTLTVSIDAPRLEQIGLGGALRGNATLTGALRAPDARWTLAAPQLTVPGRLHARGLSSRGRWDGGAVALALTAAQLTLGTDAPPLAGISVAVSGRPTAHRVQASVRVGSDHAVRIDGEGGVDGGRIWRGRIDTLAWQGPQPVRLADPLRLELGAGHVVAGRAAIVGEDWQAVVDGLRWEAGRLQSSGRFGGLPARLLLPATAAAATLRVGGDWDVDFTRRADGRIRVFRERGDVTLEAGTQTVALGLERLDLLAEFSGQQAAVSLHAAGSRAGTLSGRLTAGLRRDGERWQLARQAPWQGSLRFETPSIAWLGALAGENVLLGGRLDAAVDVGGTPARPAVQGRVAADGLRVALLDHGLDLGGGVLRLDFTPETARLRRLELTSVVTQRPREGRIDFARLAARPGRLVAEGEIAWRDGSGRIGLQADRVAVSELPDRWIMVSGSGNVRFADGALALAGDAAVDAAYVELAPAGRPALSADVVVLGRERKETTPFAKAELDLKVNLGEQFHFRGAGLQSRLAGEVRLTAERDVLLARGSVRTVAGTFQAYGRELAVERGILNFQGLADNPGLNVRALRKNQAVEAGVEVAGTLKNPKVDLVSVPDVPDTEKLSWMLLGRPPGALAAEDADLLLSAAMTLRGSQGEAPLQSLMRGLGLDELGISSGSLGERGRFAATHVAGSFDEGGTAAERIATVGKRIGANAVLSYEHSLASAESIVKLTVELSRRVSVVGRVGADNAIGLIYSFAFGGGR